ncbi:unnamed protein product, partial [Prorocentrum cordatum]
MPGDPWRGGYCAAVGEEEGTPGARWRRLAAAAPLATLPLALLGGALALRGGPAAQRVAQRAARPQLLLAEFERRGQDVGSGTDAESVAAVALEPFTCGKYGCLDVRSMAACGCSQYCQEDGNCCPDYTAVCAPARIQQGLGAWGGCPQGAAPPMPQVPGYSPVGEALRVKVLSYNPEWWHVIEQLGGNSNSAARLISQGGPSLSTSSASRSSTTPGGASPGPGTTPPSCCGTTPTCGASQADPSVRSSASGTRAGRCWARGSASWPRTRRAPCTSAPRR